jgi:hypothetical protein
MRVKRKLIDVAELEHLRTIEVRNSAGGVYRAFVIEGGVVSRVSSGSCVDVFGKSVGGLDVPALPAA